MARDLTGKHPNYYEAILQLRDVSQEVIDFTKKEISNQKMIATKIVKLKNGMDYYLSDNTQTRNLGKKLEQHFGGKCIVTASLHTKKDNKELYRTTILFREIPFRKGDIIEYDEEIYTIKSLIKDIFLQKNKTGKKVHLRFSEVKQIKKRK